MSFSTIGDGCSHGVSWDDECIECEKVGLRNFIENWGGKVDEAKQRLAELEELEADEKGDHP